MKRRLYHRGYNVELVDKETGQYSVRIGGKRISGTLLGIKQSIDWWKETNILRNPNEFVKQDFAKEKERRCEEYKKILIMNDTDNNEKEWYMMVKGHLLKGSLKALKKYIDDNLEKNI